jgi:nucleoside 2-deoxyribosyltransferase
MSELRIYLAGPDVFLPDPGAFGDAKIKLCAAYGFIGVSPFDNEIDISGLPKIEATLRISAANEEMMRSCQLLIANLTPFRGPSADVGTAYELGFARALGLPVFGYTNVADTYLERTRQALGDQVRRRASGQPEDGFHMAIENFDCTDNLMLVGAVHGSGATIVANPTPPERRFTDLAGFETCLKLAAAHFGIHGRASDVRTSAP